MYDVTIIGCGVIGASIAYTLSQYKLNVLVLERENDVATGTTKANSAIVHAGYDPEPGTLMAKLNVRGCAMMEDLANRLSVEYKRPGALVLAFDDADLVTLKKLYDNGVANGVPGVEIISAEKVREMEPNLADNVVGALWAPSVGLIDPWGLCIAEAEVAVRNGVTLKLRSGVTAITDKGEHYEIETASGTYESRYIVNAAGLWGEDICNMTGGAPFTTSPSRGEYYLLDKSSGDTVSHVIFQCPSKVGKGVLVSPTVHGNLIVGPNAADVADPFDVSCTYAGLADVATAARKSVPNVNLRDSIRNFAGVRANTNMPDFLIEPSKTSPRMILVCGIKSPGLASSPAIGEYAAEQLETLMGVEFEKNENFVDGREQVRFRKMTPAEKAELIAKNPLYGRVICRCETITEGEIVDAIRSPITPCSVDGIKRRAGAGMGRCQGGFCGPRVLEIMSRELGIDRKDILQDKDGTIIITGETKGGAKA